MPQLHKLSIKVVLIPVSLVVFVAGMPPGAPARIAGTKNVRQPQNKNPVCPNISDFPILAPSARGPGR